MTEPTTRITVDEALKLADEVLDDVQDDPVAAAGYWDAYHLNMAQALRDLAAENRQQCGLCGQQTLTKNPHPDAGKPERLLEVGAVWECIPCQRSALHTASNARYAAEQQLAEARQEIERLRASAVVI